MKLGKFLSNINFLTSFSIVPALVSKTKKNPKKWQTYIAWIIWSANLSLTVSEILDEEKNFNKKQENRKKIAKLNR